MRSSRKLCLLLACLATASAGVLSLLLVRQRAGGRELLSPPHHRARIFCLILAARDSLETRAVAVNQTWAWQCDGRLFVVSGPGPATWRVRSSSRLPLLEVAAPEGRAHLWQKVRLAFQFSGAQLLTRDFDYFLKADVDTFVVMSNLRSFLLSRGRSPDAAWWTGRLLRLRLGTPRRWRWQRYMSGGAGYVLSRGAVRSLLTAAAESCGPVTSEDVNMGVCMQHAGVEFVDSFDPGSEGGERFHPLSYASHLNYEAAPTTHWLWHYSVRPVRTGQRCCSSTSISFHYVSSEEMRTFHFLMHKLRGV